MFQRTSDEKTSGEEKQRNPMLTNKDNYSSAIYRTRDSSPQEAKLFMLEQDKNNIKQENEDAVIYAQSHKIINHDD